jgi:antitoxin component YwqK of YwqJK toxin-antitoxin module
MKKLTFFVTAVLISLITYTQDSAQCVSISHLVDINGYKYLNVARTILFTGKACLFYLNGKRKSELPYFNGKLNGEVRYWHSNGNLSSISQYEAGIQNGVYQEWDSTGKVEVEGQYKNDRKEGVWFYFENGVKNSSGWYKNSQKEGVWFFYSNSGEVLKQEFYDKEGNCIKQLK